MNSNLKTETAAIVNSNVKGSDSAGRLRRAVLSPFLCSVLASIGIFGGISALFSGLVCVIVHAALAGDTAFDRVGTVLLIAAIPMILVGSIFLDEIEKRK
jgi:hypothetical protein